MDNYVKTSSGIVPEKAKEPHEVFIKSGSKIRTCVSHALNLLQQEKKELIIITGSGPAVTKAITTAEIVKRKNKGLHQHNHLFFSKTEDLWEPKQEGLDKLKVTRNIPSIAITLSTKLLDRTSPGYQAPGEGTPLVKFRDEDIELADEPAKKRHHKESTSHQKKNKTRRKKEAKGDKERENTKREGNENQIKKLSKVPQQTIG
ncbi:ribonuclease P protein subunit p25-like protein [Nematostella vectensis]|uniref:ribonuclease P protein subunit p25-like protein n=1 Tax=Nematostella vectensis TaxID=45351 RepID=UPI0013905706|nr:ribonuclease P protein subunit p25-like protein [Nematostella vectensis]